MEAFMKQPSEKFPINIDFTAWLDENETISECQIRAYLGNADVAQLVISSYEVAVSQVRAVVMDGEDGGDYHLHFQITTTAGNIYEKDILMHVREERG